jgi:hypothetical protein
MFWNFFFFENRAVNEIMCKNIVELDRPQMTVWHMHIACWKPKATNTHSEYVIFVSLPPQQWLHKCASMLLYTYAACHVSYGSGKSTGEASLLMSST